MITLIVYMFLILWGVRLVKRCQFYWYSSSSFLAIMVYWLILNIYWVGDIDFFYWELRYMNIIWLTILLIYMYTFTILFYTISNGLLKSTSFPIAWGYLYSKISQIFHKILKDNYKDTYKNDFDDEWCTYNLKYNKRFKSNFLLFLEIFPAIFLIFRLFLYIYYFYFAYKITHKYMCETLFTTEKFFLFIILFFVKLFFIYSIIISSCFKTTNINWIFLFCPFDIKFFFFDKYKVETYIDWYLQIDRIDHLAYFKHPVYRASFFEAFNFRLFKKKNNNLNLGIQVLFDEVSRERFILPKDWYNVNYKVMDCLVNNIHFYYWLEFQFYKMILGFPLMIMVEFIKFIWRWDLKYDIKKNFYFTPAQMIKYEKNLKKYKIK